MEEVTMKDLEINLKKTGIKIAALRNNCWRFRNWKAAVADSEYTVKSPKVLPPCSN